MDYETGKMFEEIIGKLNYIIEEIEKSKPKNPKNV